MDIDNMQSLKLSSHIDISELMPQDDPGIHIASNDMIRVVIKTKKSDAKPPPTPNQPAGRQSASPAKAP